MEQQTVKSEARELADMVLDVLQSSPAGEDVIAEAKAIVQAKLAAMCVAALMCLGLVLPSGVAQARSRYTDDQYYCKFTNSSGSPSEISRKTGVRNAYAGGECYSSGSCTDWYVYLWRPGVGVIVAFSRKNNQADTMETYGFTPGVEQGSCVN